MSVRMNIKQTLLLSIGMMVLLSHLFYLNHAYAVSPEFSINSQVRDTKTGKQISQFKFNGEVKNIFKQQKSFVYKVLGNLGIKRDKLPKEVRQNIDKLHTTNIKAFIAYSKGIDLKDKGRYKQASMMFRYARTLDPAFRAARSQERKTPTSNTSFKQMRQNAVVRAKQQVQQLIKLPTTKLISQTLNTNNIQQQVDGVTKEIQDNVKKQVEDKTGNIADDVKNKLDQSLDNLPREGDVNTNLDNVPDVNTDDVTKVDGVPDVNTDDVTKVDGVPDVNTDDVTKVDGVPDVNTDDVTKVDGVPDVNTDNVAKVDGVPDVNTDNLPGDVNVDNLTGDVNTNLTDNVDNLNQSTDFGQTDTSGQSSDNTGSDGSNSLDNFDIEQVVNETNQSLDLMLEVQEKPAEAKQLMANALKSDIGAGNAFESVLFGLEGGDQTNIKEVLKEAVSSGMSFDDAKKVVKNLKGGNMCQ